MMTWPHVQLTNDELFVRLYPGQVMSFHCTETYNCIGIAKRCHNCGELEIRCNCTESDVDCACDKIAKDLSND